MPVQAATDRVSEISRQLERAILSGEFAEGAFLPAERRLSEQFGVSRSVIREALGRLTSLGLVESRHGSGSRVAPPSARAISVGYERLLRSSDAGLADLGVVRLTLETTIAALAAIHRTDSHLTRLAEAQSVLGNPRRSLIAHVKADAAFHSILAEASGNRFFPVVLAPIHDRLTDSRLKTLKKYGAHIAHEHHDKILEAVREQDADAAADAMREHLTVNSRHLEEMSRQSRRPVRPR